MGRQGLMLKFMKKAYPNSLGIPAKNKENLDALLKLADDTLHSANQVQLLIPHSEQKSINLLFSLAKMVSKEYTDDGLKAEVILNQEDRYHFEKYIKK